MLRSCIWGNFLSQRHLWVNIKHAGKKELCNTNLRKPWSLCYHHVSQISLSTSWMKVFYYIVSTKYITTSFTKIATNRWRCPQPLLNYLDKFPKISKQASSKQYLLRIYYYSKLDQLTEGLCNCFETGSLKQAHLNRLN